MLFPLGRGGQPVLGACFLFVCICSSGRISAGDGSDECSSATRVGVGTHTGSTAGASNDGTSQCGNSANSRDVWFVFSSETHCSLVVDTEGSDYDTVLAIHSECPGDVSNQLVCNDDAKGTLQSRVAIIASPDVDYLIRVAGFGTSNGNFTLNLACEEIGEPGQGDTCAEAEPIVAGETLVGDTAGSVSDGAASCGNSSATSDAWYQFTAAKECFATATTCGGANFDTVLSVHSGCPGLTGNEVVCNDDSCDEQSTVGFQASAGETYYIRVSGRNGDTGPFSLEVDCRDIAKGVGPDLAVTDIRFLRQVARLGDAVALSLESWVCNIGNLPLDWFANPNPNHPYIVFNLYRLRDDRLEQVGQSWAKHGFAATQGSFCEIPCERAGGSRLGVGCGDIYGTGTNASQGTMTPRDEINPWTGEFVFEGSHLDGHPGGAHDVLSHRLRVDDADLGTLGAQYFVDLYILSHDDSDRTNSLGWKPTTVSGSPGDWDFGIPAESELGPVLDAWEGSTRSVIPEEPLDDGRCYLAAKAIDLGDGFWRYEYALFNLDMDRGVASFSSPLVPGVAVRNAGVHAVASDRDGYSNDPWMIEQGDQSIVWSTATQDVDPASNPLRWGTPYNFFFEADAAPVDSTVALGMFKPGTPDTIGGATIGPAASACGVVDTDGDSILDLCDNCGGEANADQRNSDEQGDGDVCDVCPHDPEDGCIVDRSGGLSIGPDGGSYATPDATVSIDVPAGTFAEPTSLAVTGSTQLVEVETDQGPATALYEITLGPQGMMFDPPIEVVLSWADDDNDGMVDGTAIPESVLYVTKDDVVISDACSADPNCDMDANRFTILVPSFSDFSLVSIGDVFLRADCNGDGRVLGTVTEAVFLLTFTFLGGETPPCLAACDMNGDGFVGGDVADSLYILGFLFLGSTPPPPPFPACGLGALASDRDLGCVTPLECP